MYIKASKSTEHGARLCNAIANAMEDINYSIDCNIETIDTVLVSIFIKANADKLQEIIDKLQVLQVDKFTVVF